MSIQRTRKIREIYNQLLILANIQTIKTGNKNNSESGALITTNYKHLEPRLMLKKWMIKNYLIELQELGYIDTDYKYINDKRHNLLHIYLLKINKESL